MTFNPQAAAAAALALILALPGAGMAQEAAGPPPSPPERMGPPADPASPDGATSFRRPPPTTLPPTRLYIKNNTRLPLTCTLAVKGAPPRAVTFEPGQEFAERFSSVADLALTCPQVRRAAFGPLLLGARYAFVRLRGAPQLVEVDPGAP